MITAPLLNALSVMLPTAEETPLLRACLSSGETARQSWEEWQRRRNDSGTSSLAENQSVKKLLLLVFDALRRSGLETDKESQTYLRSAYLKEELRSNIFRRICREVLLLLAREGIPTIVLKGAALAETVYDNPVLRHCHDIDLLVSDRDLRRAAALLRPLGFTPRHQLVDGESKDCILEHESGLPLVLHSRLFEISYYPVALAGMWARSEKCVIADVEAQILSPADSLFHVCGHAFYAAKHKSLRWVCDAWFIIHRHRHLDWDLLRDCARRSRLTLPLSVTLGYLAEHLNAPIPSSVLDFLFSAAAKSNVIEKELALFGARTASQDGPVSFLHKVKAWRAKVLMLQWMLFPSPTYLSLVEEVSRSWLLPLHYVYRPLRYARYLLYLKFAGLLRRIKWRVGRLFMSISFRTP